MKIEMDVSKKATSHAPPSSTKDTKCISQQKHKKKVKVDMPTGPVADNPSPLTSTAASVSEGPPRERCKSNEVLKKEGELLNAVIEEDSRLGGDVLVTLQRNEVEGEDKVCVVCVVVQKHVSVHERVGHVRSV